MYLLLSGRRSRLSAILALVGSAILSGVTAVQANDPFDLVVRNGRIVDGTGAPWYVADVGVTDGIIVRIGRLDEADAERVIDATGCIVCPGFIDMMGQTAEPFLEQPEAALNLLSQGITTINAGEGHSPAPVDPDVADKARWRTLGEYFLLLEQAGLPINVAQTIGHTQVRRIVLGEVDRRPTDEELDRMREHVRVAMEDGAIGLSTALIYPPATYGTTEEIAALAEVAGQHGGRYYTHMRNEGDRLLEAIDEALEIGDAAGCPVHIFHLKAAGRQNWKKIGDAIARIESARRDGRQVTADIYPYVNNGLGIAAFIHPRHFVEGHEALFRRLDDADLRAQIRHEMETEEGWENWYRHVGYDWGRVVVGQIEAEEYREYTGRTLAEIADAVDRDPWDVFFDIVPHGAFVLPESMSEQNKIKLMQQDFISFCTDVGPDAGGRIASHPRAYGAFPRVLARYVGELDAISLERAIAKASAVAANEIMAYDRGRVAVGQAADIVVFDADRIADRATLAEPHKRSEGIEYVVVNGAVVLENGEFTGRTPGRVLRGPGYRADRAPAQVSTGRDDARMESFDRLMTQFIAEHGLPGAALAVTDQGRLVYARGYGYADISERRPVKPSSLFRIASISKPITAAAILQLVEQDRLTLNDRVFDVLTESKPADPDGEVDPRLNDVTVRHLLNHSGGWDRDESFDAMFRSVEFAKRLGVAPPAGPAHVIRCMMNQPLDFDPGARYAYSNYGYCLLGRIIEHLSGQAYECYVQEHVLRPLGITEMRIGRTRREDGVAPGEVRYYEAEEGRSVFDDKLGEPTAWPYGAWSLEAMDSHGGWIASAVDLARFAVAFDNPQTCPILSEGSIQEMFARPPGTLWQDEHGNREPVHYALGWMVRRVDEGGAVNTWHTGSLNGTATLLVRRHDGRNWAVLFNSRRSRKAEHMGREIDRLLHAAADAVIEWPQHDLFCDPGSTPAVQ